MNRGSAWTPQRALSLRKRLGLTLIEMGHMVGVSDASYSRWETGKSPINLRTAFVLEAIEREEQNKNKAAPEG